jgi:hypothetical protein
MVWEGLKRDDAAKAADLASSSLRFALHKPHVLAFYRAECDALRNSLKARNLHRLDTIADERQGKPGAGQLPGLQIVILQYAGTGGPVEPIDVTPCHGIISRP